MILFIIPLAANLVLGCLLVGDVLHFLPFGAAILKPNLHLCLGDVQQRGDFSPFTGRQVLLGLELLLELEYLSAAEGGSSLLFLLVRIETVASQRVVVVIVLTI